MTEFLEHILDTDPTFDEMVDWVIKQHEKVNSKKAASGYIRALNTVGAVVFDGERIKLTPEAADFMEDQNVKKAQRMFLDSVAGAEEAYDFMKNGPKTVERINDHIKEAIKVSWESEAQTRWRLYWLESLGLVEKTKNGYQVIRTA